MTNIALTCSGKPAKQLNIAKKLRFKTRLSIMENGLAIIVTAEALRFGLTELATTVSLSMINRMVLGE